MPNCTGYMIVAKVQSQWYAEVPKNLAVYKDRNKAEAMIALLKMNGPACIVYEIEPIKIMEDSDGND